MLARRICLALAIVAPTGLHVPARAQDYPSRVIRLVMPFAAGGGADVLARILARAMSDELGQSVVVENRTGGDGVVAATAVANAPPDGYTVFMAVDPIMTMIPTLRSKIGYDPVKDFAPIALLASQSMLIVANDKVPARNLTELVAYLKANPGKINIGSASTNAQLFVELFKSKTGTQAVYVPYRGSAQTVQAVVAGDIEMAVAESSPYVPFVKQGKLHALATTGMKLDNVPEVPSIAEAGFPQIEMDTWQGLFAPAATPPAIVKKLNATVVKVLGRDDVRKQIGALGRTVTPSTPEELAARVKAEHVKWDAVIKSAGIKIE